MTSQPSVNHHEVWVTRQQAADLSGCSVDTIKRKVRQGMVTSRQPAVPGGHVEVTVGSLIDAGLYTPADPAEPVELTLRRTDAERELEELRERYHRAEGSREQLQLRLDDAQRQIKELNGQLKVTQQQVGVLVDALSRASKGGER